MNAKILQDIGLTKIQSITYLELVKSGGSSAPAMAAAIGESRSNAYKILDKLCALGIALKDQQGKKVHYIPVSPTSLEQYLRQRANDLEARERALKAAMPEMLQFFFAHTELPSIRYFQGKEGIRQIFGDMLETGRDIYLLRSPEDVNFYDETFFAEFRKKRALLGIKTYALTPNVPSAVHDINLDFKNKFVRTWLKPGAYTGAVEWDVYGNKVALISYDKEAMGIIVENANIAESFRQVFELARTSAAAERTLER